MGRHYENWIDAYLDYTEPIESSTLYRKWVAISTVAACLQRRCRLEWDCNVYPNFYIVLVGPPGGRKGTAMAPAYDMLLDLGVRIAPQSITREGLIRLLREIGASWVDPDTGDTEAHSSLTVFSKEFAVFIGYGNSQFLSDLSDIYDCERIWTYLTKNAGTDTIQGLWLNLIGATTPALIKNILPVDTGVGGGLASRMIFVYAPGKEKVVPFPFVLDHSMRGKLMEDLEDLCLLNGKFSVTEDFLSEWGRWYVEQDASPPFREYYFKGYCDRRAKHALKLAMVCSASRTNTLVMEKEDLTRAVELLTEVETVMPKAFLGYGKRDNSDMLPRMMDFITVEKVVPMSKIVSHFLSDMDRKEIVEMVNTLSIIEFCSIDFNGGKPIVTKL